MHNQACFETELEIIQAIPGTKVKSPKMPVGIYIQEATDLEKWAEKDREQLLVCGLPSHFLDTLPSRIGALIHAQSLWMEFEKYRDKESRHLQQLVKKARELEKELHHILRYALPFQKKQDLNWILKHQRKTYPQLVQHLNDLKVIGYSNQEALQAKNVDLRIVEQAEEYSSELSHKIARTKGLRKSNSEHLMLRNKAYTHLKEAVDQIRYHGKFLFRNNNDRLPGYCSTFEQKRGSRYRKQQKNKSTPAS